MLLNLQNSFEDRRVQFPSSYKLMYFSDLHSFEKRQAATCRFSKEFCASPGNVLNNRKEGIKTQKRRVNALESSKEF
jgi:hypothetical protein